VQPEVYQRPVTPTTYAPVQPVLQPVPQLVPYIPSPAPAQVPALLNLGGTPPSDYPAPPYRNLP
jgi:hypothetical protein